MRRRNYNKGSWPWKVCPECGSVPSYPQWLLEVPLTAGQKRILLLLEKASQNKPIHRMGFKNKKVLQSTISRLRASLRATATPVNIQGNAELGYYMTKRRAAEGFTKKEGTS